MDRRKEKREWKEKLSSEFKVELVSISKFVPSLSDGISLAGD